MPLGTLRRDDLECGGGKGANLGELISAGLPVPPGFCITTAAYRRAVAQAGLMDEMQDALRNVRAEDPGSTERAIGSRRFRRPRSPASGCSAGPERAAGS